MVSVAGGAGVHAGPAAAPSPRFALQEGHAGRLTSTHVSADGRLAFTGADDGTARLWDLETGAERLRLPQHVARPGSTAMGDDARRLLYVREGGYVSVVDATTGRETRRLAAAGGDPRVVAVSGDGRRAAVGYRNGSVRLWDLDAPEGKPRAEARPTGLAVLCLAFDPDGRRVLVGDAGRDLRPVSLEGQWGARLAQTQVGTQALAWSADGRWLAAGQVDGSVVLHDESVNAGEPRRLLGPGEGPVTALAFLAAGRQLAVAGGARHVRLLDTATGRLARTWEPDPSWEATAVAAGPHGQLLVGGEEGHLRLWDPVGNRERLRLEAGAAVVVDVQVSPEGHALLARSDEGTVQVWNLVTGRELSRIPARRLRAAQATLDPAGRRVLVVRDDGQVESWRVADVGAGPERSLGTDAEPGTPVRWLPRGRGVVTGRRDGALVVTDPEGRAAPALLAGHAGAVLALGATVAGDRLASAGRDRTLRVWDVDARQELRSIVLPEATAIAGLSPDGRLAAARTDAFHVSVWSADDGRLVRRLPSGEGALGAQGHTAPITGLAFAPDGASLVTTSADRTAIAYDLASGARRHAFVGHGDGLTAATFLPDGRLVLTASRDRTVRFWKADDGAEACALVSMRDGDWAVFEADGHFDASRAGTMAGLYALQGAERIEPEQWKGFAYDPG